MNTMVCGARHSPCEQLSQFGVTGPSRGLIPPPHHSPSSALYLSALISWCLSNCGVALDHPPQSRTCPAS